MSEEELKGHGTIWLDEPVDAESRPVPARDEREAEAEEERTVQDGMKTADRLGSLVSAIETAQIAPAKAVVLRSILKSVRQSIDSAIELLEARRGADPKLSELTRPASADAPPSVEDDRVIEGVFNGSAMVGDDGKEYAVPPNYASKSKLVEGDLLKLSINDHGNFIYKQIGPIERERLVGTVAYDQETGQFTVLASGRSWRVLKASVTYFRADTGDEAVILVPKNAPSRWAAVENIIKRPANDLAGRD